MTWRRFDPLAGVGAVVLWIAGTFLLENTDRPEGKDSAAFAAWVTENDTEIITGTIVFGFGVVLFVWFLGALRTRLLEAEGGAGQLTAVAFAGGLATGVMMMATYLPWAKAAFDNENMTDPAVEAVVQMGDSFFGGVELFAIPLLVGTGLVARRTGALPKWLAWFSFVLALVLAIVPIGWAGVLLGLPLWTLITAVVLYRTGASSEAPPAPAATDAASRP
jgi:hypothetical protein